MTTLVVSAALGSCGAPPGMDATSPAVARPASASTAAASAALLGAATPSRPAPASHPSPTPARSGTPDAEALFRLLEADLVTCYELGKQATPEMNDGKLTLNASFDATGKPLCVIPSDSTGLTQEVVDCMSARFGALDLPARAPWTTSLPVLIRRGAVQPGERTSDAVAFDTVETFRMPDAFDTLDAIAPALQECVRGLGPRSTLKGLLVGARVGADGRPQCALAASRGTLPPSVGECAASVLRGAKFPPPKLGAGLVVVPIALGSVR